MRGQWTRCRRSGALSRPRLALTQRAVDALCASALVKPRPRVFVKAAGSPIVTSLFGDHRLLLCRALRFR